MSDSEPIKTLQDKIGRLERQVAEKDAELLSKEILCERIQQYRTLLNGLSEGYCMVEMTFDDQSIAVDYRFLEVNKSFENQTGLIDAVGKSIKDLEPAHEDFWFNIYGKVALTGEPEHFEAEIKALGRYFEISAYPVPGEKPHRVALFFNNITRRKQSEEQLRLSEERFSNVFHESPMAILVVLKKDYTIVDVNPVFLQLFEFTREEVIGHTTKDLNLYPDYSQREKALNNYFMHGNTDNQELKMQTRNNKILTVLFSLATLKLRGEEHILSTIIDITERKEAEQALHQNERALKESELNLERTARYLQSVIDNVYSGVALVDEEGKFTVVNNKFLDLFGIEEKATIRNVNDKNWAEYRVLNQDLTLLDVDEHPVRKAVITRKGVKNQLVGVKLPLSEDVKWILVSAEPIFKEDGSIDEIICTYHDITDYKKATESLEQSEEKYRTIVETANEGIWIVNEQLSTTFTNKKMAEILGYESEKLHGIHFNEFLSAEVKGERHQITDFKEHGGSFELKLKRMDGSFVWSIVNISPLKDRNGKFAGALSLITDISERKKAELVLKDYHRQLEKTVEERTAELSMAKDLAQSADRLKTAFMLNMSHELRTPLNSIIGFSGILLHEFPGPLNEEQKKQLVMIQSSGRHLLSLINDILDISKIESGELKPHYESFNIDDLIQNAVNLICPFVEKKGLSLLYEKKCFVDVVSDHKRLQQVLLNILNNAVKFTEKGNVEVSCLNENNFIKILVSDTGIGIMEEDILQLFNPFIQLENNLTRNFEGSGLGLSISKKIMEMLNGDITVQSVYGTGSTFTMTLPITDTKNT